MALFSVSCFKSYYFFLVYWILDLSITIVKDLNLDYEIASTEYLKGTEFIYISCLNIADLFAVFLVMRTNRKMKTIEHKEEQKKKEEEREKNNSIELIYNDLSIRNHKYSYLFLISLLEFIARCTDLFYVLIIKGMPIRIGEVNWLISFDTLARIILSSMILRTKIYIHHKFSLVLILIGLFSMSVCAFKAIKDYELQNWPYFLFIIVKYIILPLEDVINKILLTDEFLLPHYLMLWRGMFDILFLSILSLLVLIPGWVQFHYFDQFEGTAAIVNQVFDKVLFTIFSFCKAFCLLKVLDYLSPSHVAFCNTAFSLYQLIKCRTKSQDKKIITTTDSIFLSVIIFGTLVFNEVIIINAFGLNSNTKKGFLKKAKLELQDMKDSNDSDDDDDDSDDIEETLDTKQETLNGIRKDNNKVTIGGETENCEEGNPGTINPDSDDGETQERENDNQENVSNDV